MQMMPTSNFGTAVLVPDTGLIQVFQREVEPETVLRAHATGVYVGIRILHHDTESWMHLLVNDTAGVANLRAQRALKFLAGAHMMLPGPVLFTDLPGERAFDIVRELS